jgi:hypothetical protein
VSTHADLRRRTRTGAAAALVVGLAWSALASATVRDAARVTVAARPAIAPADHPVTLYGTVDSARPGERVEIQAKDCGHSFFRSVTTTTTELGGKWTAEFFPGITASVRAVWKGHVSKPIVVRQRALLRFAPKANDRSVFVVSVVARAQFWRKRIVIERFSPRSGRWSVFRSVVLSKQTAPGEAVWTSGELRARVSPGTLLRAVLPAGQAAPCYLGSTSLTIRT